MAGATARERTAPACTDRVADHLLTAWWTPQPVQLDARASPSYFVRLLPSLPPPESTCGFPESMKTSRFSFVTGAGKGRLASNERVRSFHNASPNSRMASMAFP